MTTLTDFLLARIAEDEAVAREARGAGEPRPFAMQVDNDSRVSVILVHSARVLAECEAKRRIVEQFKAAEDLEGNLDYDTRGAFETAELAVSYLAQVYADHPDYVPAWRI